MFCDVLLNLTRRGQGIDLNNKKTKKTQSEKTTKQKRGKFPSFFVPYEEIKEFPPLMVLPLFFRERPLQELI